MSPSRRRGFPEDDAPPPAVRKIKKVKKRKRRRFRPLRALLRLIVLWIVAVSIYSAVFVGVKCYSRSAPENVPVETAADPVPGYTRAETFTYLTLPEWFIVYSADEQAAFLATSRPSRFPYFGSARQYWQYYSAACAVTKRGYPFETGYHAMLAVIGASFTIENTLKGAYEQTIGRFTEWLSSPDTPEDAFARQTAKEYGAFMHSVPWYEFPFWGKLRNLWRDTPIDGPHRIRKLERRLVLSVEYGAKAAYGWIIGKASGAAYAAEDRRIHARIGSAPRTAFADARVKQVKPLGQDSYVVTLPRYEEFTRTALALSAAGVRFLDIAGNDEILVTVLLRRGVSLNIAGTRLVAARPILTDPTLQRVALSVPVKALPEVVAEVKRGGGTVEHLYDY